MRHFLRIFKALLAIGLSVLSASAFDSPLSGTAVREAYFLGQRHDGWLARSADKYAKHIRSPKFGPNISSVKFLTPFAQLVQYSDSYVGNYSAQQAQLDHRGQPEFVKIFIQIQLTDSYGRLMIDQAHERSGSPRLLIPRPYDFWKDFRVLVSTENQPLAPSSFRGTPDSMCGRRGSCILTGATLELEFPAESFTSASVTILVIPPEGDQVSVEFDLVSLR